MKHFISESYNEATGITILKTFDDADNKVHIQAFQDVDPMFEQNKNEFNHYSSKSKTHLVQDGLGTKVASIPMGLVEKLYQEGFNVYRCSQKDLKKLLNNPDYSKIRTAPGRV